MVEIKHLSVSVNSPEKVAKALAEMTSGKAESFISKNMSGAWVFAKRLLNAPHRIWGRF